MKFVLVFLLCIAFAATATTRYGGYNHNEPAAVKGSYTIETVVFPGLTSAYGFAIQDDVANSMWVSQYIPISLVTEYDMSTGNPTGNTWAITSGVDADDMGYCSYSGSANEFFFGHWAASYAAVYDVSTTGADPYFVRNITGPAAWDRICGVDAGYDNLYASSFMADEIAWGSYTGVETSVTWSTAAFATVSGMAVWDSYLFVCTQEVGVDNIFIFELNPDGSPNMTPVWSCVFNEDPDGPNGGLDYDGEFLWVYPQNADIFKLDIDWVPSALEQSTWGSIKTIF